MCSRTSCMESIDLVPTPLPGHLDPKCHSVSTTKCMKTIGEPMRPLYLLTTPTPTTKPSPTQTPASLANIPLGAALTSGSQCTSYGPDGSACVLEKCRQLGTCVDEMSMCCATWRPGSQCCSDESACARKYFQSDTAFCGTDCSENCMHGVIWIVLFVLMALERGFLSKVVLIHCIFLGAPKLLDTLMTVLPTSSQSEVLHSEPANRASPNRTMQRYIEKPCLSKLVTGN